MARIAAAALLTVVGLISVACGSSEQPSQPPSTTTTGPLPTVAPTVISTLPPTASAIATPSAPATSTPTLPAPPTANATPTPRGFPNGSVIVTFQVEDETYRVLLITDREIRIAYRLLAGRNAPPIPNGLVLPGDGGVNQPWSWHIDPASLEFADVTTEVCDGLPSFVERGTITGDRFCPWGARVIAVTPANE